MSEFIQDKIDSINKKKKEKTGRPIEAKNTVLKVIFAGIIVFYAFMLTSRFTMGSGALHYDVGKKKLESCSLTVSSWTYSSRQHMMEVVCSIEDCYVTPELTATAQTHFIGYQNAEAEIVAIGTDICVIHIYTSETDEVALSISDEKDSIKFFNNKNAIVSVPDIKTKSLEEYRITDRQARIDSNLTEIEKLTAEIEEQNAYIEKCKESINAIQKRKTYMSKKQIEEADSEINSLEMEIRLSKENILTNEDMISEYKTRNTLLEKEINDIRNGVTQ